jgi:hypothetical protein
VNAPSPSRWSDLFDIALSIIDQANSDFELVSDWTFGGGTALMLQIDHRERGGPAFSTRMQPG